MSTISAADFTAFTKKWGELSSAGGEDLKALFLKSGKVSKSDERLVRLSFPVLDIAELLSAVGMHRIKARFLAMGTAETPLRFSVALYAVDASNYRLTAYFVPAEPEYVVPTETDKVKVGDALAAYWLQKWTAAPADHIDRALFATRYNSPLMGYDYDIADFLDPIQGLRSFSDAQRLYVHLGLHPYTMPGDPGQPDAPAATLGLVLQLAGGKDADADLEPYYDLSEPSPPGQ